MKVLGTILIVGGISTVLVGAGTSDMRVELGVPTTLDGVVLGIIGFFLFSAGAIALAARR